MEDESADDAVVVGVGEVQVVGGGGGAVRRGDWWGKSEGRGQGEK